MAAFEHQTRFTKLHETRAETIGELYRRLVQAQRALRDIRRFRNRDQDLLDKVGVASDATEEFYSYFDECRLYFPKDVCEKVEEAHKGFVAMYNLYQRAHISSAMEDHEQLVADLKEAHVGVSERLPEIRQALEDEFRQMLTPPIAPTAS